LSFAVDKLALSDEDYGLLDMNLTSEFLTIMADTKRTEIDTTQRRKSCQLNDN
jgi:hypothetical protein